MPDRDASTAPCRVRLERRKGYRKPEGAIVVARPTKWGNPVPIKGEWIMWTAVGLGYYGHAAGRRAAAVAIYRSWLLREPVVLGPFAEPEQTGGVIEFGDGSSHTLAAHVMGIARVAASLVEQKPAPVIERPDVTELRGHDLACWCPLDQPCHADVLLELANSKETADVRS